MKDTFTEQQREIVARKMGYDGPMSMFDTFLNSTPDTAQKYASITDKYVQRMNKGGAVSKFAAGGLQGTVDQWFTDNPGATPQQVADAIKSAGGLESNPGLADILASRYETTPDVISSNYNTLTTAPAATTTAPAATTAAPAATTTAPAATTAAPAATTTAPAATTAAPTIGTAPVNVATSLATAWDAYSANPTLANKTALNNLITTNKVSETQLKNLFPGITDASLRTISDAGVSLYTPTVAENLAGAWAAYESNATPANLAAVKQMVIDNKLTAAQLKTMYPSLSDEDIASAGAQIGGFYKAPLQNAQVVELQGLMDKWKTNQTSQTASAINQYIADNQITKSDFLELFPNMDIDEAVAFGAKFYEDASTKKADELALLNKDLTTLQGQIATLTAKLTSTTDETEKAALQTQIDTLTKNITSTKTQIVQADKPVPGLASKITAALNAATEEQKLATQLAPATATTAKQTLAGPAATAAAPTATTAAQMTASTATPDITTALADVEAAKGAVSSAAQVTAATQTPSTTALAGLQGAQLDTAQQAALQTRTAQAGEMVSGSTVDQTRVEAELAKNVAAQGTVTEDMTVQGQLAKLTANFDASNPPAWAAGSLRAAAAQMAARGLSASSMAGQAMVQAALEAATPVAAADAKVFQDMGLANLSNRQQIAVLTAQQRATFLGQEFDQNFQTRVLNAAKVSDIANQNFSAAQQVALENARLAQSVDLANLSNDQAVVMANAAQMATLETANLNNRQQAAVANAQAFLQMDMANLSNEQQTVLFKSQQLTNSMLADTAAANAAKQFNATSQNQTDQFFAGLTTQVAQFNATQTNAINQFNTDQANTIAKFNADVQNQRDAFNAQNRLVIDQSNAQWLREISTANTAATNAANTANAQLSQQMTLAEYNNMLQLYRDQMTFAWQSAQNDLDRATKISTAQISGNAQEGAAETSANGQMMNTAVTAVAAFAI